MVSPVDRDVAPEAQVHMKVAPPVRWRLTGVSEDVLRHLTTDQLLYLWGATAPDDVTPEVEGRHLLGPLRQAAVGLVLEDTDTETVVRLVDDRRHHHCCQVDVKECPGILVLILRLVGEDALLQKLLFLEGNHSAPALKFQWS